MSRKSVSVALSGLLLSLVSIGGSASAMQAGEYRIALQDAQGERFELGSLVLSRRANGGFGYRIDWDDAPFQNYFLSMRPFKCVPHPAQLICHLVYPYDIRRVISPDDLTDLEYDLLFLHKTPQEYGINAWNGLYFDLAEVDGGFVGELRETDLNVLQAPPEDGDLRPISQDELYDPSDKHWPRRVLIQRVSETGNR